MTSPEIHEILLGHSAAIRKVRALIERVAPTELPVLISGPTGVGKELVATAIHAASGRSGKLVTFNVCAIAESMFEDALFGHVRGAFTGALNSSPGFLREANEGTAFFDEIGGLNGGAQTKLLRAIETHEFRPVGGPADVHSDFRLVAATNEDVWMLERDGRFRADLAHRLSAFVIRVPPLRERIEDVQLLSVKFCEIGAKGRQIELSTEALQVLKAHNWPGNVRELRQVIRSAVALSDQQQLRGAEIREVLSWAMPVGVSAAKQTFAHRRLQETLEQCNWSMDEAARQLGIHRTTLYRRLKRGIMERDGRELEPLPAQPISESLA